MNLELLEILKCLECGGRLSLDPPPQASEVLHSTLRCEACRADYPVVAGVPRFVPAENYAASFGFQWNRFSRTQLDSHSGLRISADRFYAHSGWGRDQLEGKRVLDVGCGAGRFTEVALDSGARVVAVDYSLAVDACRQNHADRSQLDVIQADIYDLPFPEGAFDFVYCFGVLQHTPDVRGAFAALVRQLKPGGRIAVDLYARLWTNVLWPKYWLRPITRRMQERQLLSLVERAVRWLLPVSRVVAKIPLAGRYLRWLVPVANYEGIYPLDDRQMFEWSVLDTFDMLAPAHDHPIDAGTLQRWFQEEGLSSIDVFRHGHVVGRGVRG